MITKRERLHMDVYNEDGIKEMDAHGLYDFDELTVEMVRALAHKQIPVIRLATPEEMVDTETTPDDLVQGCMELQTFAPEEGKLAVKWSFDGVEFTAEGPAEYVMRASAELLEYLEALT